MSLGVLGRKDRRCSTSYERESANQTMKRVQRERTLAEEAALVDERGEHANRVERSSGAFGVELREKGEREATATRARGRT